MLEAYYMDIANPKLPPSPIALKDCLVKEVWSGKKWFTSMRLNYQRAVCVMWDDNSITVEPVSNLIDFVKKEICEKIIPVLYNWKISVKYKRCKSNYCVFCINKRKVDDIVCKECSDNTQWIEFFINEEKIKRENLLKIKREWDENIYITDKYFKNWIVSPSPESLTIPTKLLKRKYSEMEQNFKMLDLLIMDISI